MTATLPIPEGRFRDDEEVCGARNAVTPRAVWWPGTPTREAGRWCMDRLGGLALAVMLLLSYAVQAQRCPPPSPTASRTSRRMRPGYVSMATSRCGWTKRRSQAGRRRRRWRGGIRPTPANAVARAITRTWRSRLAACGAHRPAWDRCGRAETAWTGQCQALKHHPHSSTTRTAHFAVSVQCQSGYDTHPPAMLICKLLDPLVRTIAERRHPARRLYPQRAMAGRRNDACCPIPKRQHRWSYGARAARLARLDVG